MSIKKKDGSIFKLRGPNKFIKSQNQWKGYTLHNCKWKTESIEHEVEVKKKNSDYK